MDTREEALFKLHFMRIVNMCRDGITDDELRITAGYCGVSELLVMRVAHDMRTLTPEQEERYQVALAAHLKARGEA